MKTKPWMGLLGLPTPRRRRKTECFAMILLQKGSRLKTRPVQFAKGLAHVRAAVSIIEIDSINAGNVMGRALKMVGTLRREMKND